MPNQLHDIVQPVQARPIGVSDSLRRVFHKQAMTANKLPMAEYLNPLQMVLEEGAAAKLVHMTRISFERDPRFIIISRPSTSAMPSTR